MPIYISAYPSFSDESPFKKLFPVGFRLGWLDSPVNARLISSVIVTRI